MPARPPVSRLSLTRLEDRTVPALFGVTWPDPQNLSVSFAPDGTDVGGVKSTLNATLDAVGSRDVWQAEIRRAFQTWAAVTNIDVRAVPDSGGAFGGPGQLQANWKQGDIRIAARPLSTSQVAVANPPDLISGWAGEIVLNSNYQFSVGGANGTYDLYSVVLHEAGHALGLSSDHAATPSSAMYEGYAGVRTGLSGADVAAIQALYSPRAKDAYEGSTGNGTLKSATAVNFLASLSQTNENYVGGGKTPFVARADLAAGDADVYSVVVPASSSSPAVLVSASKVSQVAVKVTVLDSNGNVRLTATATGPGADVWLDLKSLPRDQRYYFKVEAAPGVGAGVYGVGGYRLTVGNSLAVAVGGVFTSAYSAYGETMETNDRISGILFGKVADNADARWDAHGRGQLSSATDVQTMQITAQNAANAMLVAIWTAGNVSPTIRVTDSFGRPVAFEVLRADGFATVIQLRDVKRGATYNFALSAAGWQQPSWLGAVGYRFAADFRSTPISLATFANGTLTAAAPTATRTLTVTESQVFRFELTASSLTAQPDATATLTVTDTTGRVVYTLTAGAGQTVAGDVFLSPGSYTVRLAASAAGGALLPVGVVARIVALTDPIGPSLLDPTAPLDPTPTTTAPATSTTTTATAKTTTSTTSTSTTPPPTLDFGYFWGPVLVDPLKIWW